MPTGKDRPNAAAGSDTSISRRHVLLGGTALAAAAATLTAGPAVRTAQAQAGGGKPNILVIFGDDIGIANISAY